MIAGRRVLVTGASGFIGSHVTEALVAAGARVRVFLRYTSRDTLGDLEYTTCETRDALELVRGDLRDADAVLRAVDGVEVVLHLGAVVPIPYSYRNPLEVVQTNVLGTTHVLLAARRCRTPRVVVTSTSEVYGTAQRTPIDEGHPLHGQSPYAASKIGADALATAFRLSFDLPVVIVRPFNAYGPRQSARAVIPTILSQALWGDGPIRLGSLETTRDFTYVADTADGFVRAAAAEGIDGETIQLGSGELESIGGLVARIGRLLGRKLEVQTDPDRLRPPASEVRCLLADAAKAERLLGWRAWTPLDEGLASTLAWMRDHRERYRPGQYTV